MIILAFIAGLFVGSLVLAIALALVQGNHDDRDGFVQPEDLGRWKDDGGFGP